MKNRYLLSTILVFIILSISVYAQTIANPSNFYGQEIQKVIDYLRSKGFILIADNIEFYLNNSLIIVQPLPGGQLGENNAKGGPVYLDPGLFPVPPPKGFDPSNPVHVEFMMSLAATLVHEKYHSEHHDIFDRIGGNGQEWTVGGNDMEFEAWSHMLNFLDDLIKKILEEANKPETSEEQRRKLIKTAKLLLSEKLSRLDDYEEKAYGPMLWNESELEKQKEDLEKLIEEWEKQTKENKSVKIKDVLKSVSLFEDSVLKLQKAAMENFDSKAEKNSQVYAIKIVDVVRTIKNLPPDKPISIALYLHLDTPTDLGIGMQKFYIEYKGIQSKIRIDPLAKSDKFQPDHYLEISNSILRGIYTSENPNERIKELFNSGHISLSDTKPIGRQFEETCGNSQLDRGEQCDYGYNCPNGMICSEICDCIYPGQGNPLPQQPVSEEDVFVAETAPNTGIFRALFSLLTNLFRQDKISMETAQDTGASPTPKKIQSEQETSLVFDEDYDADTASSSDDCYCGGQDQGNHRDCYRRFNDKAEKEGYRTPVVCDCSDGKCECSYCKEKRNREKKNVYVAETGENTGIFTTKTGANTGIFRAIFSLFKNLLETEEVPTKLTIEVKTGDEEVQDGVKCPGSYEDPNCYNFCQKNSVCEADPNNPGCYRCNAICANDEYYKDDNCAGLCIEGISKCIASEKNTDCYWCKPTCRIGEFYKDAKCGNLCSKDEQKCALTNPEGPCYSCQPIQKKVAFIVNKVDVSENYVLVSGTVNEAAQIKYVRVNDLFRGRTESYPLTFNKDRTEFTFKEKLELGRHILTIEADLVNGERMRIEPIAANVEQEKFTGTNTYKESNCLNACHKFQKCTPKEYPTGCYGCEAVCANDEYYNDTNCAGACTQGVNTCTKTSDVPCYWCKPLATSQFNFEFKDVDQDWKQVSSLTYGHKVHFIIASKSADVRQQLPITITITVSGKEVFKVKIPNDSVSYCRGADGCSIDGPLIDSSWQGSPLYVSAFDKNNKLLVEHKQ